MFGFPSEGFSILGYIAIVIAILVPLCWLLHWMSKPKKWFCHIALIIAILAFGFAKYNSSFYVNNIEEDLSEQIAKAAKLAEEKRKKMKEERASDVANIHFAEDGNQDFIDIGGMDETELRLHGLKKKKRTEGEKDTSLEASLEKEKKKEGAKTEELEKTSDKVVMLKAKDLKLVNDVDGALLKACRWFMLLSLVYIIIDYFRRGNRYADAYMPMPLPSVWYESMSPIKSVESLPEKRRRSMKEELENFAKRNEAFIYFGKNSGFNDVSKTYRLPGQTWSMDVLPLSVEGKSIHDDFIFETLWYGGSSFYSESSEDADRLLVRMASILSERKDSRAKAAQTVHIVWDFEEPLSKDIEQCFELLGKDTGFSLLKK